MAVVLPSGSIQTPSRSAPHLRGNPCAGPAVTKLASLVATSSTFFSDVFFSLCALDTRTASFLESTFCPSPHLLCSLPTFGGCCSQAQPTILCLGPEATFLASGGW